MLESKADLHKNRQDDGEEVDLNHSLSKIKPDIKHGNALLRSTRIRKTCNFLPEISVKQRKAYYCTNETGYFHQKVVYN